jgi:alpha-tubulin suppressor-like RCC1 family protein
MSSRRSDRDRTEGVARRSIVAGVAIAASAGCGFDSPLLTRAEEQRDAAVDDAGEPRDAGAVAPAPPLAAGGAQTYAIRGDVLFTWGRNASGELALGDTQRRLSATPVGGHTWSRVVAGDRFGCGIEKATFSVWCWGDNARGQLATGDSAERSAASRVALSRPAVRVAARAESACAILDDGSLWCWGDGRYGQLGASDGSNGLPIRIGDASDWTRIGAGSAHLCGLRAPGRLFCWGKGSSGQLGVGLPAPGRAEAPLPVDDRVDWVDLACGDSSSCALTREGVLFCWGANDSGELGIAGAADPAYVPRRVAADAPWSSVSLGASSACALDRAGALYCWGANPWGGLGFGDTRARAVPTRVPAAQGFLSVAVGRLHVCALDEAGSTWCAGAGGDGQLGLEDTRNRSVLTLLPP